jgi:hypothetical protein
MPAYDKTYLNKFHFSPLSLTPAINLYFRISLRIFVKFLNGPHGILRGPGKWVNEKNLQSKISCQTPFKTTTKINISILGQWPSPRPSLFEN